MRAEALEEVLAGARFVLPYGNSTVPAKPSASR